MYIIYIYVYVYIYIHTYIARCSWMPASYLSAPPDSRRDTAGMYICIYVYVYMYMYTYIYIHT